MRDREIVCEYYVCEGLCKKFHAGTFRNACQHCSHYKPKKGTAPARVDNRRRKLDKYKKHEKWERWD